MKGARCQLEELDASAVIDGDNLGLVLLLEGLQSPQEGRLIQPMEFCAGRSRLSGMLGVLSGVVSL